LIHNEWRSKRVLIVDLDRVIGRTSDISPIKRDVCPRCESRVSHRTVERRRGKPRRGRRRRRSAGGHGQVG
jgi:uncharacterized protein YlaI